MQMYRAATRKLLVSRWPLGLCFAAVTFALCHPAQVSASPQSLELLQQGSTLLAQGEFEVALQRFEAAAQTDPNDAQAPFFQGTALNRRGRYEEALVQLQKAIKLGNPHPDQ